MVQLPPRPPPPPFLFQLVGCLDCFNRDPTWSTHRASYIRYRVKFQCEDVGAEMEFQFWCTSIVISRIGFYGFVTTLPIWNGGFFPIGFELTVEPPAEASLEIWTFHARQNKHGSGTQRKYFFLPLRIFIEHCNSLLMLPGVIPSAKSERQAVPTGINWQYKEEKSVWCSSNVTHWCESRCKPCATPHFEHCCRLLTNFGIK